MLRLIVKKILIILGIDLEAFVQKVGFFSIKLALNENGFANFVERLRKIVPDISKQYSQAMKFNAFWEVKLRTKHAFQCFLMLKALEPLPSGKLTVADIGDSAGTHMRYLLELGKDRFFIDAISINMDPIAVEKIRARGQKAILCRAEEINLEDGQKVDLFTSFQMIEHLHNPALFLRRLAKRNDCNRMVVTLPYLKTSRVGLHSIRKKRKELVSAEDEHIFEFSPDDWRLLMLHSGWKVIYSNIYYQYPRRLPLISQLLSLFWRQVDLEGFWGAILEKDNSYSDLYRDWEDEIFCQKKESLNVK